MIGNAIVLIGVSSVGKTSVATALQSQLTEPYMHVGLDHFFAMFPYEWKDHPRGPGPGFWYEDSFDADGSPRARTRYGEAGARMLEGMRASTNALLAAGNNVILDEMPLDDSIVPSWRRELRARSILWVHLSAQLATHEVRERSRTKGQKLGNARGHYDVDHGGDWDLSLDTSTQTPSELAATIIAQLPR